MIYITVDTCRTGVIVIREICKVDIVANNNNVVWQQFKFHSREAQLVTDVFLLSTLQLG